jgi:hypothetical protein
MGYVAGSVYGYQPGPALPDQVTREKWAWLPKQSSSGKWIWWKHYAILTIYQDKDGQYPIKGLCWQFIFTKNEFLVWQLKQEESSS